uniref:CUT domain-containing protein n=1 Tax=Strongyloides papillosus TaxID=174720 RepID=A0A0N5BJ66_STREA
MTDHNNVIILNNIETFANQHKVKINRESKDYNIRKTFFDAGNDMYDTLNSNFETLFLRSDEVDVSNDILDEFLDICKEEAFNDVMEELSRNVGDDLDLKIKEKLSVFIELKNCEQYDFNACESSNSSISDYDDTTTKVRCLGETENFTKTEINGYEKNDGESLSYDNYIQMSTNKIKFTDVEMTEKIEDLISYDINCAKNLELNVNRIIRKVRELTEVFSFTLNIMSTIVAKTTLSTYYNFVTYPKSWNDLKEKVQYVALRLFAFVINKKAILLLHFHNAKKIKDFVKQIIILPHPKNFFYKNIYYPMNNFERIINLPIPSDINIESILAEINKAKILNLYASNQEEKNLLLEDNSDSNMFEEEYSFGNKNFSISEIKNMEITSFKFSGIIDVVELCNETKNHIKELKIRRSVLAEKILGISQSNIYSLLSPRREWKYLSKKGQEPYIRLRAYLDCFYDIKDDFLSVVNEQKSASECNLEDYDNKSFSENIIHCSITSNNVINDFNTQTENVYTSNDLENNVSRNIYYNIKKYSSDDIQGTIFQALKPTNNIYNNILQRASDFVDVANDIKRIMQEYNINHVKFASMYLKSDAKTLEKYIMSPRDCDFSSTEFKNCYLELKSFINKNNIVKRVSDKFNLQSNNAIGAKKNSEKNNCKNVTKFIFVPMKVNFNNVPSNISLKKKPLSIEDNPNNAKKLKLSDNIEYKTFNADSNQSQSKNVNSLKKQKPFIETYSTSHDANNISLKKDLDSNYKYTTSLADSNLNSSETHSNNLTFDNFIDIDNFNSSENMNCLENNVIFHEFYRKIMSPAYLNNVNLNQIEILYLAWTYNPNPLKYIIDYISELAMLSIHTVELFYQKTNNLQVTYTFLKIYNFFRAQQSVL